MYSSKRIGQFYQIRKQWESVDNSFVDYVQCGMVLVQSEKRFFNSNLSLDLLAHKLKTNRTYLSSCINSYSGSNFNQWINDFRIDYILKQIHSGQKLSMLAEKAGFVSTDSFYRNFKRRTNLTPNEYLKQQLAVK